MLTMAGIATDRASATIPAQSQNGIEYPAFIGTPVEF
jgi:hypothetical protein